MTAADITAALRLICECGQPRFLHDATGRRPRCEGFRERRQMKQGGGK